MPKEIEQHTKEKKILQYTNTLGIKIKSNLCPSRYLIFTKFLNFELIFLNWKKKKNQTLVLFVVKCFLLT